jgi:hypothetical protein
MKVLGKFMGGFNDCLLAVGGYVVFDAQWVNVETYTGGSVEECKECFLKLGTSFLITCIKKSNGDYLTPEVANSLIKRIALEETIDLDKYDMGFFNIYDTRPDTISICNEVDEDYNIIPLQVTTE